MLTALSGDGSVAPVEIGVPFAVEEDVDGVGARDGAREALGDDAELGAVG